MERKTSSLRLFASVVLISLFSVDDLFSQQRFRERDEYWITGGLGFVLREHFGGSSDGVAIFYKTGNLILSGRYIEARRFDGFAFVSLTGPWRIDSIDEISFTAGYAHSDHSGLYSASIGIGQLRGQYDPTQRQQNFVVEGVAFQTQGIWKISPLFTIGMMLFGNINANDSYGGLWLCLNLGNFFVPDF